MSLEFLVAINSITSHLQHLTLEFHHIFHLIRSGGVLKALAAWGPWKPFGWLLRISPLGDFSAENTRGTPFYKKKTRPNGGIFLGPERKKKTSGCFIVSWEAISDRCGVVEVRKSLD